MDDVGQAKKWQMEQEERGWYSTDGYVCANCITDHALRVVVEANLVADTCDFCKATGNSPVAAELDSVVEAVADGLYKEYEDPVEHVGWASAEGGFLLPTSTTMDLLEEHAVSDDYDVMFAIADGFQHDWVHTDPYAPNPEQALRWGWDQFRDHVMHTRRFTFLMPDADGKMQRDSGEIPPEGMLDALGAAIGAASLVHDVPTGTVYWRTRPHPAQESYERAGQLGSPPAEFARTNRMTAAGISAFYGASTRQVAIDEVRGYASPDDVLTVARFETSRTASIVDLVDLPAVPSLFDPHNRHRRAAVAFLHDFAVDVAKVSDPDDRQHLDYVPTQIVAEYLRYHLGRRVDGIRWRSTKNPAETSTVLFVDHDDCLDATPGWHAAGASGKVRLGMDPASVERVEPTS